MANSRAWRSWEMTASIAELDRAFCEELIVFMTAKAITVKASPTTTTISRSENPCSALFVRLLIPELLKFRPVACRVTGRVHVPRRARQPSKYIVFGILEDHSLPGRTVQPFAM